MKAYNSNQWDQFRGSVSIVMGGHGAGKSTVLRRMFAQAPGAAALISPERGTPTSLDATEQAVAGCSTVIIDDFSSINFNRNAPAMIKRLVVAGTDVWLGVSHGRGSLGLNAAVWRGGDLHRQATTIIQVGLSGSTHLSASIRLEVVRSRVPLTLQLVQTLPAQDEPLRPEAWLVIKSNTIAPGRLRKSVYTGGLTGYYQGDYGPVYLNSWLLSERPYLGTPRRRKAAARCR